RLAEQRIGGGVKWFELGFGDTGRHQHIGAQLVHGKPAPRKSAGIVYIDVAQVPIVDELSRLEAVATTEQNRVGPDTDVASSAILLRKHDHGVVEESLLVELDRQVEP